MTRPALKSELSLFNTPLTQVTMENAFWGDIHPTHNVKNSKQLEFVISGSESHYLDLNDSLLCFRLKAQEPAGKTEADVTFLENMIGASLFKRIDVFLNDTPIQGTHDMQPYSAILTTKLMYNKHVQETLFAGAGLENDENKRKEWTNTNNKYVDFAVPVSADICHQSKYLLPRVTVKIVYTLAPEAFWTRAAGKKWSITLEEAVLYVRRVKVAPPVLAGHELGLKKHRACYPIRKTEVITQSIPVGSRSFRLDHLFRGESPLLLIMGMVSSSAFLGDYTKDPFKFEHFKMNHVQLSRDGEPVPFGRPFTPDFVNGLCAREYAALIQSMELLNGNDAIGVSRKEYKEGAFSVFAFNMCADLQLNCGQPPKAGNLRLDVQFAEPTTEAINIVIFGCWDARIEIDAARKVYLLNNNNEE